MIRWSCQRAQGWVPVAPRRSPSGSTSAASSARRSTSAAGTSWNDCCLPVLTSTSEAISSPTRFGSSEVPCAAAWTSSKRLTRSRLPGSRRANSSSTETVKSSAASKRSRASSSSRSWAWVARMGAHSARPARSAGRERTPAAGRSLPHGPSPVAGALAGMRGIPAGPATTAERPTSVVQRRGESAGLRSGPSADHARCPSGPGHLVVAGRAGS